MILDVAFPLSMPFKHLTYIYSGAVLVGARVVVPWGKASSMVGVVTAVRPEQVDHEKQETFKAIITPLDKVPLVEGRTIEVFDFIASYYMCKTGEVLKSLVPSPLFNTQFEPSTRLLKSRHKKTKPIYIVSPEASITLDKQTTLLQPSVDCNKADIIASLHTHGTTLVLVPTVVQAEKMAKELRKYHPTTVYHPKLSTKRRAEIFIDMATLSPSQIIVGTRTSIGLPLKGLKLIVVVDEHSYAYKSPRPPRFNARDTALMSASLYGAKTLLMSNAPSVESYFNATTLPSWDFKTIQATEQQPQLRSMVLEHGTEFLSKYLRRMIAQQIALGRQVVVFQNRRGSGSVACTACGYSPQCPSCNSALTLHASRSVLECHYCGHRAPYNENCPQCKHGKFQIRGRGTERLEEQLSELFPQAAIGRLDLDTAHRYDEIVANFSCRNLDIIVGTQIVIDSLDMSNVGIVCVVNADNLLSVADFRATEQAFRIILSLSRQARKVGAELIIQTSSHSNSLIKNAINEDIKTFYRDELAQRSQSGYPPFARLMEIDMRSTDPSKLMQTATNVENALRPIFRDELSPLFQPQVERRAGEHIVKLLLKIDRRTSVAAAKDKLQKAIGPIVGKTRRVVEIQIIVDPL